MGNKWARTSSATWARHLFPVCGWMRLTRFSQSHVLTPSNCAVTLIAWARVLKHCVLLFCLCPLLLPRGSRPLLPETTARTFAMSSLCTCVYRHVSPETGTGNNTMATSVRLLDCSDYIFTSHFKDHIISYIPQWRQQTLKEVAENLQGA